ncbi:hypothetical protein JCM3770_007414 [Rhodotorula araucariae]
MSARASTTSKAGLGSAGSGTKSRLRTDAATLRAYGCFLPNGVVLCFCNTEPRIKAIRRVTRKETSPNLGREFWSCGHWVEGEGCGFFLWCDEATSKGRDFTTPPPAGKAASTVPANPLTPSSSPQKRPRARSPSACRPAGTGLPSSSPSKPDVTGSFDNVDFALLDATLDDDIEDADMPSSSSAPSASPSKKPRFESFSSSSASRPAPSTPATTSQLSQGPHWQVPGGGVGGTARRRTGGFDAIRSDPDSPFHALQTSLFGGEAGGDGAAESSPAPPSPSKGASATPADRVSALDSLLAELKGLSDRANAVQQEREKELRLQMAARRKEETLRKAVDRSKEETATLRRENEGLKERIRMLEEENNELRTR